MKKPIKFSSRKKRNEEFARCKSEANLSCEEIGELLGIGKGSVSKYLCNQLPFPDRHVQPLRLAMSEHGVTVNVESLLGKKRSEKLCPTRKITYSMSNDIIKLIINHPELKSVLLSAGDKSKLWDDTHTPTAKMNILKPVLEDMIHGEVNIIVNKIKSLKLK